MRFVKLNRHGKDKCLIMKKRNNRRIIDEEMDVKLPYGWTWDYVLNQKPKSMEDVIKFMDLQLKQGRWKI